MRYFDPPCLLTLHSAIKHKQPIAYISPAQTMQWKTRFHFYIYSNRRKMNKNTAKERRAKTAHDYYERGEKKWKNRRRRREKLKRNKRQRKGCTPGRCSCFSIMGCLLLSLSSQLLNASANIPCREISY